MTPPVAQTGAGNVTTATIGAGSSVTISKPSNLADGDLLVAVLNHHVGGGTWSAPSGWDEVTTFSSGRTGGVWVKPIPDADSETASDYTWSTSGTGSGRMGGLIVRVTGADLGAPVDAVGNWQAALGATGVTTTRPDCLLLGAYWGYITGTTPVDLDPPGTMTEVGGWTVSPSSSSTHLLAAEERLTAGATGSRTATSAPASSSALSILVAVAAPQDASATITQQTAVTASAALDVSASADLVQPTAVTAHAEVLAADQQASASIVQPTRVVVAHPAQPRILVGGQWQPTSGYLLINGSWVRLTAEEDED